MLTLVFLIGLEALPVGNLLFDEKMRETLSKTISDPLYVFGKEKKAIRFTVHLWLAVLMMAISITTLSLLVFCKRTPAYVLGVSFNRIFKL